MWQRIQTIYLAIAALLSGVSLAPLPYNTSGTQTLEMNDYIVLIVLCALVAAASLVTIVLFKNRTLQLNLCRLILALLAVIEVSAAYFAYAAVGADMPQVGSFFPVLAFMATLLAIRGIRADERLIRSMDRLR